MIRNFINKFGTTLYVQIWENRIKVTDINTSRVFDEKPLVQIETNKKGIKEVTAIGNSASFNTVNPFSHPRVLFADFFVAEVLLKRIFKQLVDKKLFSPAPAIVIHPMEKIEGGLTMIEIRAFMELAHGAGARGSVVHQGAELQPSLINFEELAKRELAADKMNNWI